MKSSWIVAKKPGKLFLLVSLISFLFSCSDKISETRKFSLSGRSDSLLIAEGKDRKIIDSLYSRFKFAENDSAALEFVVEAIKKIHYKKVSPLAEDVISFCHSNSLDVFLNKAYISKLYSFSAGGQLDSANHYYAVIREKVKQTGDISLDVTSQVYYALCYAKKREMRESDSLLLSALKRAVEVKFKERRIVAIALYYYGLNQNIQFKNEKATRYLKMAEQYAITINDYYLLGEIYFRLGECYLMESDYNNAINAYGKSINFSRWSGNQNNISSSKAAIGEIYIYKEDFSKAETSLKEAIKLASDIGYPYQVAYSKSTLGTLYWEMKQFDNAIKYFNESNEDFEKHKMGGNTFEKVRNYLCLGEVYLTMNNIEMAEKYFRDVERTEEYAVDPGIKAETLINLGEIAFLKKDYAHAILLLEEALNISKEIEVHGSIKSIYEILYKIYNAKSDFKNAFKFHVLFTNLSDSLSNKTQIKKFAELESEIKQNQLKAEHDKKEAVLLNEKLQQTEKLNRQKLVSYGIAIGLIIVLILTGIIYRSLRENKEKARIISEQKKETEHQKEIIEEKKKEIVDSISYAKKIQEAILPSGDSIAACFAESFVFYKPKDIVAGDFYWLEKSGGNILIAAGDCTGHGVPGAMVSVVCSNALNRAVKEFNLSLPGEILNKVRELVIETFEKSGSEVKDGMDISLISIPERKNSEMKILWAGANNPLWFVNKGVLQEIKANKQPVGKYISQEPFTTHTINLTTNDSLYLITDGFADQFGGPKGKKFKYKNLKELLQKNNSLSMNAQHQILSMEFEAWKMQLEQVDDVTILGLRL